MNAIQELEVQLNKIKDIKLKIDKPLKENGIWDLDIFYANKHINVCWQEGKGFGLAYRDDAFYGEGCDELYDKVSSIYTRIIEFYGFLDN